MKQNKKIILILIVGIIVLSITIITQYDKSNNLQTDTKNYLSIKVKNDEGTYKVMNTIPTEGYVLNKTKSKCENGSTLSWKEGKISITGNKQDKCNIYLEKEACKENETIENCLKRKDVNSTLLFHNGTIEIDGQVMDAGDYSYRYAGASEKVNNYVCFGGECSNDPTKDSYSNLYRIIGLFPTNVERTTYQMKIIKADATTETEIGGTGNGAYYGKYNGSWKSLYKGDKDNYFSKMESYYWNRNQNSTGDGTNDWSKSNLNTENLNKTYLNYIKAKDNEKWYNMIEEHTWITEGNTITNIYSQNAKNAYNNEITSPAVGTALSTAAKTYKARVGLMYVSDYMYAAIKDSWGTIGSSYNSVASKNWMYMGLYEWTITRQADFFSDASYVDFSGRVMYNNAHNFNYAVRPSLYLKSNVKIISGSGTSVDPYILDM